MNLDRFCTYHPRMTLRQLAFVTAGFVLVTLLSVAFLDGPVALALRDTSSSMKPGVNTFMTTVEYLFLFPLAKWAIGAILLVIGAGLLIARKPAGWALVVIGASHLASRLIAGVLKNVFLRPRPYEALTGDGWADAFFTAGSSFPSGHAAHFWSLFFPLALFFPRWKWAFLILPVLVSAARVVVNDHYVSDVLGSAAIAAAVTWSVAKATPRSHALSFSRHAASGRSSNATTLDTTPDATRRGR